MRFAIGIVILFGFACSGAAGMSGASPPAPVACLPVGENGQLDTQSAGSLVVAPDEKHVAYLRDPHLIDAGCVGRGAQLEVGTLVMLELQSDGSVCERAIAENVSTYSIFYSSDSQDLTFRERVDGCEVGTLKTADSDGSNVRLVHGSVSSSAGIGSNVFFSLRDQDSALAAPMAGGKTITLGTPSELGDPRYASNATGTAFAYRNYGSNHSEDDGSLLLVAVPSGKSQTLVDGTVEAVGNRIWSPRGNWFAFCHGPKGGTTLAGLSVVSADGSTRVDVSTDSPCYSFTFSPDDSWFLYPELDSSGGTRILTYSLKDRASALLGVLPAGAFYLWFSDDGATVLAGVDLTVTVTRPIYAGPPGVSSSLRHVVDTFAFPPDIVSAGGYVAIPYGNWNTNPNGAWTVDVYPTSGGDAVTILGSGPRFEPGVAQPHLLMLQYPPRAVAIAATDGTSVTSHPVSDLISFASWLGSAAVYGTAPDSGQPVTISALTQAGSVKTLLASETDAHAWASIDAPTRIFYSRKLASAGGPAGVFYAELPR